MVKHSDLEDALLKWLRDVRSENVTVDGLLLKEKARKLADVLQIEDFKGSEGWLLKFKECHGILFKEVQGGPRNIDLEAVDDWRRTVLQNQLEMFTEDDMFNVHEAGLFWFCQARHSLSNVTGAQQANEPWSASPSSLAAT